MDRYQSFFDVAFEDESVSSSDFGSDSTAISGFHEPIDSPFHSNTNAFDFGRPFGEQKTPMTSSASVFPSLQRRNSVPAQIGTQRSGSNNHNHVRRASFQAGVTAATPVNTSGTNYVRVARAVSAPRGEVARALAVQASEACAAVVMQSADDVNMTPRRRPIRATIATAPLPENFSNSQLYAYWKSRGSMVTIPKLANDEEINISRLVRAVNSFGGILYVRNHKKWGVVAESAGIPPLDKQAMNKLKRFYAKHVCPLEEAGIIRGTVAHPISLNVPPRKRKGKKKGKGKVMAAVPMDQDVAQAITNPTMEDSKWVHLRPLSERRFRKWRNSLDGSMRNRLDSYLNMRLFLIEERQQAAHKHQFTVLGAGGDVNMVTIGLQHSCSCPEFKAKGQICGHLFFILYKLLKSAPSTKQMYEINISIHEHQRLFNNSTRKKLKAPAAPSGFGGGLARFTSNNKNTGSSNMMDVLSPHVAPMDLDSSNAMQDAFTLPSVPAMNPFEAQNNIKLEQAMRIAVDMPVKLGSGSSNFNSNSDSYTQPWHGQPECVICLGSLQSGQATKCRDSACQAGFHRSCLQKWASFHLIPSASLCPACGAHRSGGSCSRSNSPPPGIDMDMDTTPSAYVNLDFESQSSSSMMDMEESYSDPYYFSQGFGTQLSMIEPPRMQF